jgi:hypothetical protein
MKGNEPTLGYGLVAVLIIVAVADLLITKGKGAPKHTTAWEPVVGIVLALVVAGTLRLRNRMVTPLIAVVAVFFLTLDKGPNSLELPHLFALILSIAYALTLSMRQRREQRALTGMSAAQTRRAQADARRRRRKGEPEVETGPKRPAASRRYTPPKAAKPAGRAPRR